jgi:hypothetical protein
MRKLESVIIELLQLNRIEIRVCRFEVRSLVNEASSSIMHGEARMVIGTPYTVRTQNSQHSCDQIMDRKVGFRGHQILVLYSPPL